MGIAEPARLWWLLAVAAYAAAWWWRRQQERQRLVRFGEKDLIRLLIDPATERRRWCFLLGLAALVALVAAAARPQFGTKLTEIRRRGNDVIVAMDVSASMLAEDVPPSRMAKAKRSLGLLIQSLKGDRVGVIAFAGDAFLQCPLTLDVEAAGLFLDSVSTGIVPVPGTALGSAVRRALAHFPKSSQTQKILVLLTDGEDTRNSDPLGAAQEAKKAGVKIFTLGLGTPEGDVIKLRDESGAVTSFKKDDKGETVLSRLDEATLLEIARITGGRYYRSTPDDSEILTLAGQISSFAGQTLSTQMYRVREERYQPLVLLAVLLLIAEFLLPLRQEYYRRVWEKLKSIRLPPLTLPSPPFRGRGEEKGRGGAVAHALLLGSVLSLLATPGQTSFRSHLKAGNRHYTAGRLEEARQEYFNAQAEKPEAAEAPYNTGNTYYHEGEFEEALEFYEQADTLARHPRLKSVIAYNRGCALFRAGQEGKAIQAFKETLRWNSQDEDAKYNLEWIKSSKRPRQPQQGKGPGGQDPQAKKQPSQLSKEDAERILEMVRDQERKTREAQRRAGNKGKKPAVGVKDW